MFCNSFRNLKYVEGSSLLTSTRNRWRRQRDISFYHFERTNELILANSFLIFFTDLDPRFSRSYTSKPEQLGSQMRHCDEDMYSSFLLDVVPGEGCSLKSVERVPSIYLFSHESFTEVTWVWFSVMTDTAGTVVASCIINSCSLLHFLDKQTFSEEIPLEKRGRNQDSRHLMPCRCIPHHQPRQNNNMT